MTSETRWQSEKALYDRLKRHRGKRKPTYDEVNTKRKRAQNKKESIERVKIAQKPFVLPQTTQLKLYTRAKNGGE